MKEYIVTHIAAQSLKIDGKNNDFIWDKAVSLTDFCSPWENTIFDKIEFKALWTKENLLCRFRVEGQEVHLDSTEIDNKSINKSDRVELFFRIDDSLSPYYCLEIDPSARLMDFRARPVRQFDFDWNWPAKHIEVRSVMDPNYFIVEIALSIDSLKELGILKNGQLETGIFRAKYKQQESGSYKPIWITWVDPKTETPDFHSASSFGRLRLMDF
jgi:hypothetical protein